jgi:hypothetical protein
MFITPLRALATLFPTSPTMGIDDDDESGVATSAGVSTDLLDTVPTGMMERFLRPPGAAGALLLMCDLGAVPELVAAETLPGEPRKR